MQTLDTNKIYTRFLSHFQSSTIINICFYHNYVLTYIKLMIFLIQLLTKLILYTFSKFKIKFEH